MISKDNQARKIAQKVRERYNLSIPVNFNEIIKTGCCKLVRQEIASFLDGYTDFSSKPPIIYLNNSRPYEKRRRFTLAHELGHIFIPWHNDVTSLKDNDYIQSDMLDIQEREANVFASELLMPSQWIKAKANLGGSDSLSSLIDRLSSEANTSIMACIYALEENWESGNVMIIMREGFEYAKKVKAVDTCSTYYDGLSFVDMCEKFCIYKESFYKGYYKINYYKFKSCPSSDEVIEAYSINNDLEYTLKKVSDDDIYNILHCLNTIVQYIPDNYCILVYKKNDIISTITSKKCNIRFGYEYTKEDIINDIDDRRLNYGDISVTDYVGLIWVKEEVYQEDSSFENSTEDSKTLLKDMLFDTYRDCGKLHRINGVIGSANGRNKDCTRQELYSKIKIAIENKPDLRDFSKHEDFERFISLRLNEIQRRK